MLMHREKMKKYLMWLVVLLLSVSFESIAAPELLIGAGDMLKISVYNNPDLNIETRVSEGGQITFPLINSVTVEHLSVADAEKKIAGLLEAGGFLRKPQINIVVTLLQSQQVSVLGQVTKPGRYPLDGRRSVTDMLALAGGASVDGGDIVILIRNGDGGEKKEVIDLVAMMRSGDMTKNVDLAAGDILYVDRAPRFYIYGEVQRPGVYRLERNMTVAQALSAGGGLSARGTERGLRIKRDDGAGNSKEISAKHDDVLQADDVVYVQESLF
jgi:polysaccharide export outer membrane protein